MTDDRIAGLARQIAAREAGRAAGRAAAAQLAERLRAMAVAAAQRFAGEAAAAGAPHLDLIRIGPVEPDDKSIRAFQIRLARGRFAAVIVVKDRGEVMLVGPFRQGGAEGPCRPRHGEGGDLEPARLQEAVEALLADLIDLAFEK